MASSTKRAGPPPGYGNLKERLPITWDHHLTKAPRPTQSPSRIGRSPTAPFARNCVFPHIDYDGLISAGILLGYQSERSRYVVVQLGAYGRAYSIAEYNPAIGWQGLENVGSAKNLEADRDYALEVIQTGQEIRMIVDGVPVIERVLPAPLSGSQLGLFVWGRAPVEFRELTVAPAKPQVFVAMQFGQPFDTLYQEVIFPRANALGLNVLRIDEIAGPGIIFEDIKRQIAEARS